MLEQSIRVGIPVLLENVLEKLDPSLDPILLKQTFKQQGRVLIRLGDTDVDYSEDFKFYITSTLPNPHYPPEVCIKVTIVNFTVTFEGLEDQLLADVAMRSSAPLLQAHPARRSRSSSRSPRGGARSRSSRTPSSGCSPRARGNILDDEQLINTLDDSKKISAKTEESVKGAEETTKEIDIAREAYRPVATRGSILYFVVADFAVVDPMYQFSLQYFKQVFSPTVKSRAKSDNLDERLQTLLDAVLRSSSSTSAARSSRSTRRSSPS